MYSIQTKYCRQFVNEQQVCALRLGILIFDQSLVAARLVRRSATLANRKVTAILVKEGSDTKGR